MIPKDTTVKVDGLNIEAKGPHGTLALTLSTKVEITVSDNKLLVSNTSGLKSDRKFHGLYRSLINNLIIGVSKGFTRKLELVGVGYRASVSGSDLVLDVGYSTSKKLRIPTGIKTSVEANNVIVLWGIDKQKIGQFAANIRAIRPPEPYKGKGIKYAEEVVRRKAGKTGAVGKGQ